MAREATNRKKWIARPFARLGISGISLALWALFSSSLGTQIALAADHSVAVGVAADGGYQDTPFDDPWAEDVPTGGGATRRNLSSPALPSDQRPNLIQWQPYRTEKVNILRRASASDRFPSRGLRGERVSKASGMVQDIPRKVTSFQRLDTSGGFAAQFDDPFAPFQKASQSVREPLSASSFREPDPRTYIKSPLRFRDPDVTDGQEDRRFSSREIPGSHQWSNKSFSVKHIQFQEPPDGPAIDSADSSDTLVDESEELLKEQKECEDLSARLKQDKLSDINIDIAVAGESPFECNLENEPLEPRSWALTTTHWEASALYHKPLYFEQEHVERYGHSRGPILQPVVSAAHFFATVPVLPYKMGLEPPGECVYSLGYYRPGSCAPYLLNPIPISLRAGLFQAAAVTGAVFLLP